MAWLLLDEFALCVTAFTFLFLVNQFDFVGGLGLLVGLNGCMFGYIVVYSLVIRFQFSYVFLNYYFGFDLVGLWVWFGVGVSGGFCS